MCSILAESFLGIFNPRRKIEPFMWFFARFVLFTCELIQKNTFLGATWCRGPKLGTESVTSAELWGNSVTGGRMKLWLENRQAAKLSYFFSTRQVCFSKSKHGIRSGTNVSAKASIEQRDSEHTRDRQTIIMLQGHPASQSENSQNDQAQAYHFEG